MAHHTLNLQETELIQNLPLHSSITPETAIVEPEYFVYGNGIDLYSLIAI